MSEPTEVVFRRDEDGTVSRQEPEGPWPEHTHISAPLIDHARDDVLKVERDPAGRATRVTFALPGDAATYDLTPESGLGEQVWVYGADLSQPITKRKRTR